MARHSSMNSSTEESPAEEEGTTGDLLMCLSCGTEYQVMDSQNALGPEFDCPGCGRGLLE